jgi:hypothetical protein
VERYEWRPGDWTARVEEVSSGVYEVVAVSPSAGEIRVKTTDPEAGLAECRKAALALAAPEGAP